MSMKSSSLCIVTKVSESVSHYVFIFLLLLLFLSELPRGAPTASFSWLGLDLTFRLSDFDVRKLVGHFLVFYLGLYGLRLVSCFVSESRIAQGVGQFS